MTLMSCGDKPKEKHSEIIEANDSIKIEYFKSGRIKVKAKLKDGVEHGSYFKFYENQSLAQTGLKIKGKMNGVWKYYNSKGEINSVKHFFNDSILYNLDVNDFSFSKRIIKNHLEVNLPIDWNIIERIDSEQVLISTRKDCDKSMSFCPSITITYESSITDEKQIMNYIEKSNIILSSSFKNYKTVKERKYIFDGQNYYEKIYIGNVNGMNLGGITTWIFDKKNTYIISGLALNEKEYSFLKQEGLFKDITNSIKLIN
jgi:hypothetical protein